MMMANATLLTSMPDWVLRPLKKAPGVVHMAKPVTVKAEDPPLAITQNSIPFAQIQAPEGMETTVISYDYDPLYRLTEAVYTGAIAATYRYDYDAVGNMAAYTNTVGTETTSVSRFFDAANRLQTATDLAAGTTSYYFDENGNLTQILPLGVNPGDAGEQLYSYDQRNLLTSNSVGVGSSVYNSVADYVYDGSGNRVQQVDHTGSQPITTTYTNDNLGLSQVLVADNGITTTHNLFGLDLIHQDDVTTTRTLLADGLGSARTEMVGSIVETVTTYEPYGNLLAQTGTSDTVYGFTGEQHDSATGLLYLRARYFNPAIQLFMTRDSWQGNMYQPMSYNPWLYVYANPINLTDPTGLRPIARVEVILSLLTIIEEMPWAYF